MADTGELVAGPFNVGTLESGVVIRDYRLEERIGQGGFGEVWRARNVATRALAAIKVFSPGNFSEGKDRERAARRFVEGVRAMDRLSGASGVVSVRAGPERDEHGRLWFAMPLYDTDLSKELAAGELTLEQRAAVVDTLLEALGAAHLSGVSHQDIKPQNVLLSRRDGGKVAVVLTDFDLARFEMDHDVTKTAASFAGAIQYLPPEIIEETDRDRRNLLLRRTTNDVYAVCRLIFALYSQDAPLPLGRAPKHIVAVLDGRLPDETRWRLAELCATGLASGSERRFTTVNELATAWRQRHGSPKKLFQTALVLICVALGLLGFEGVFGSLDLSSRAAGVVALVSTILFGSAGVTPAKVTSWLRKSMPEWTTGLQRWAEVRTERQVLVVGGGVVALIVVSIFTDFYGRRLSFEISPAWSATGSPCMASCESRSWKEGELRDGRAFVSIEELADLDSCQRVVVCCPDGTEREHRELSWFPAMDEVTFSSEACLGTGGGGGVGAGGGYGGAGGVGPGTGGTGGGRPSCTPLRVDRIVRQPGSSRAETIDPRQSFEMERWSTQDGRIAYPSFKAYLPTSEVVDRVWIKFAVAPQRVIVTGCPASASRADLCSPHLAGESKDLQPYLVTNPSGSVVVAELPRRSAVTQIGVYLPLDERVEVEGLELYGCR